MPLIARIKRLLLLIALAVAVPVLAALLLTGYAAWMPGRSHQGPLPPLSPAEQAVEERLRRHVHTLAGEIGERNWMHYEGLEAARDYIADELRGMGYAVELLAYEFKGEIFHNVEAVLPGTDPAGKCLVVGAHYDSVEGSPGANDNASGVAVMLELARELRGRPLPRTLRFVAFANEEPPFFNTGEGMGSVEYVRSLPLRGIEAAAMLSLETVGYYREEPGSQLYPPLLNLFYPSRGDFIAFVGNFPSRSLVRKSIGAFRREAGLPSEGISIFSSLPGIAWSDHRSFWHAGIPALMVTDTALFRDPQYHAPGDTPERLDFARMARLVTGLETVVNRLGDR